MKGKGPISKFREGNIEVAIWEQAGKNPEEQKSFFTITLKKSWKKKGEEEWQSAQINFYKEELEKVFSVLQQAGEELENVIQVG